MKILFYTHLTGDDTVGLSYSVPSRIEELEKIDDVLWVNSSEAVLDNWRVVKCFHKLSEFGTKMSLSILPDLFRNPDVVVFEDFYYLDQVKFSYQLRRHKIPYIIVPRSNLTYPAQHNKSSWKKLVFNNLIFYRYSNNALCIQYLTKREYEQSGDRWNKNYIIVPNGFNTPAQTKEQFSNEGVKAIYIGRMSSYHKGLDLLVQAINVIQERLRASKFEIDLYGKDEDDFPMIKSMIHDFGLDDIIHLPGYVLGEAKKSALLNADIFVQVSRLEGMPMGVLEAFSYGLPVLISEGTNLTEIVDKEKAGWTCDCTIQSISKTILQMIEEKNKFSSYGKNATKIAEQFKWDNIAEKFHKEIVKLL